MAVEQMAAEMGVNIADLEVLGASDFYFARPKRGL